ncbi:Flp family type IVb pilin [Nocardioides sp. zg-DK7169]|uniref:Flp family type IVb pilin n=1 Tax=Nocardioides sp. zg-DK7169 TaxID=2736600 RepID=UPI0015523DC0|nr:Flp family type IVb pilin [Nocardioides sp. zg-DK7169]NPC95451.1 Flp family type IVb pilin [Nocardioides sp. zg-DK7169]
MIDYLRILLHARLDRDERGASAVEYGLLVAGIAAVIILAVFMLGETVTGLFNDTKDAIDNEGQTPVTP